MKYEDIKDFSQRCEEHPDHQTGMINERMIQQRLNEEIDELRAYIETKQEPFGFAVLNEVTEQFNSVNCGTIYRLPAEGRSPLYTTPQPKQEQGKPVAEVTSETGAEITMSWWHEPALPIGTKLYTTPQQRTWVGLTNEERLKLYRKFEDFLESDNWEYKKAIEAELKDKNL